MNIKYCLEEKFVLMYVLIFYILVYKFKGLMQNG